MKKWHERPLRVFDLALEDPYGQWLDRWTAEDMVRTAVEANAWNTLDVRWLVAHVVVMRTRSILTLCASWWCSLSARTTVLAGVGQGRLAC